MSWIKPVASLAAVIAVGWMFLAPPVVKVSAEHSISCVPLGPELPGTVWLDGYDSSLDGAAEAITAEVDELGDDADGTRVNALQDDLEAGVAGACGDARENRMALLTLTIGVALAALIVVRTRRPEVETVPADVVASGPGGDPSPDDAIGDPTSAPPADRA